MAKDTVLGCRQDSDHESRDTPSALTRLSWARLDIRVFVLVCKVSSGVLDGMESLIGLMSKCPVPEVDCGRN